MKKLLILALCAAFVFALAGCEEGSDYPEGGYAPSENTCTNKGTAPSEKGENVAVNDDQIALLEVEDLLKLTPQKMLGCDGFDIEKFTSPFYNSQIQYCEGFFLLENEDGGIDPVELAFPAAKILEVRSNDLSVLYEEGRDYILNDNGSLTIPAGSGISALSRNEFFVSSGQWSEDGKPVINTTDAMYRGQYVVTYIRTEGYDGTKANHGRSALTTFASATDAGEEINVLVLGDSIAAGAGVKDFPNWANMTKQGIEYYSQSTVNLSNAAVPGIHTGEYVGLIEGNIQLVSESIRADAQAKFALAEEVKADTDLVIIAIGGNDAGGWCGPNGTAVSTYKANVEKMIGYVRAASPDCSVLLVSCMQTNPKISDSNSGNKLAAASFSEYENALSQIAEATANCALANVYGVESSLLVYKNIEDMLGDNINHPSDYMSRIYTQVVLSALFDL